MLERLLCMREAWGSFPTSPKFVYLFNFSVQSNYFWRYFYLLRAQAMSNTVLYARSQRLCKI